MGLSKFIKQPNGITLGYHRIVSIRIYTNIQNTIEIESYISYNMRIKEIDSLKNGITNDIYKIGNLITIPYDQNMTITTAYKYLKTLPEFENAEDIFEDN